MSIYYRRKTQTYIVRKFINGRNHYVGSYKTRDEAKVVQENLDDNEYDIKFKASKTIDNKKWHNPEYWNEESSKSLSKIFEKYA